MPRTDRSKNASLGVATQGMPVVQAFFRFATISGMIRLIASSSATSFLVLSFAHRYLFATSERRNSIKRRSDATVAKRMVEYVRISPSFPCS